jgi:hypothetical protein
MHLKILFLFISLNGNFLSALNSLVNPRECGMVKVGIPFLLGGDFSTKGQWPWFASIIRSENNNLICGSSIISKRHLLGGKNVFGISKLDFFLLIFSRSLLS